MFSKACEYGIRACIYVASHCGEGRRIPVKEVADVTETPPAFMAKILQSLVRGNILESRKGPTGGFYISKDQCGQVKLADIVRSIDGDRLLTGCGLGLPECSNENPCPVHDSFLEIRNDLNAMLESTSLKDLNKGLNKMLHFRH